jgi:uncharacterized protein YndB with AHSA1/START domain
MTTRVSDLNETEHRLYRRRIPAGEARCAVFRRAYDASIEDVWAACTDPERLRRWYAPVEGELRLGGSFTQGDFGVGRVVRCEAPRRLTIAVGEGDPSPDEVELRLEPGRDGSTVLELEHATTLDAHEIGGQLYDAVYCMGGGYGPRLVTLQWYLRGELPGDIDPTALHLRDDLRSAIEGSMTALAELLDRDAIR